MCGINPNTFDKFIEKPNQVKAIDLLQDLKIQDNGIEWKLKYIDKFHLVEGYAKVKEGCFDRNGKYFENEFKGYWKAKVEYRDKENGCPYILLLEQIM